MDENTFLKQINNETKHGLKYPQETLLERLNSLDPDSLEKIARYTVLNHCLDVQGMKQFFPFGEFKEITTESIQDWVLNCYRLKLLDLIEDGETSFFNPNEELFRHFERNLSEERKYQYHTIADKFLVSTLTQIAINLEMEIPEDENLHRAFLIGPNGLLDVLAHLPQIQDLFQTALGLALTWQNHSYQLKNYKEAADIVNMIWFALSRQGQAALAESLLVRIILVTKGSTNLIARLNLATLLRGQAKLQTALKLYRGTIFGLLRYGAITNLTIAFSNIGTIYRQNGFLLQAVIAHEFCGLLQGLVKNGKEQAITRSQLASTYRYMKLYRLGLRASKLATDYFRSNYDYVNLGRSLLTKGNIYYNLRSDVKAINCFDEALEIGKQIADFQSICGALSGKARVNMLINKLDEVKPLLEEAISIRLRNNDKTVGVEYSNLGSYFEAVGNLPMALGWYSKALNIFQQYMPVEVPYCERKISNLEKILSSMK
jgi:tetratricopeptide (TPR) repeat protein